MKKIKRMNEKKMMIIKDRKKVDRRRIIQNKVS